MTKIINLPTALTEKEVRDFNDLCKKAGILPAKKIGELVHGFLVAEGVKHQRQKRSA